MRRRACIGAGVLALGAALPGAAAAASRAPLGVGRRALEFPADHGAHPDTRTEWWYATGWLQDLGGGPAGGTSAAAAGGHAGTGDAATFGFQITFFRSRTDVAPGHPSRFAAHQLLFAHAAVTDLAGRRMLHDQRLARAGFGLARYSEADTDLALRGWSLQRAASGYRTKAEAAGARFAFDLELQPTQPLLLQGDAGYSRKGPGYTHASHYYSQPQLAVRGSLAVQGRSRVVRGRAWLDHEWSESLMPDGAVGWDWIGINLFDGSALTAFRLRRADAGTVWAGGSWRAAGGQAQAFGPEQVQWEPADAAAARWRSPATGALYPMRWRVGTPAGRFEVRALLDAQEQDDRGSTGSVYWEGLSALHDERGQRIGLGYLEMTGYAGRQTL